MLKTNVDKVLEILNGKKSLSVVEVARACGTTQENILKTGEYLEEEGLLKIEYKFMKPYLTLHEKKAQTVKAPAEDDTKTLNVNKNILENEVSAPEQPSQVNKDYASLGQEEISNAEFPKEITPLANKDQDDAKEKKLREVKYIIMHDDRNADDKIGPAEEGEEPSNEENTTSDVVENEYTEIKPANDSVSAGEIENASGNEGASYPEESIGELIDKANNMIDSGHIDRINEFYEEIYDKLENEECEEERKEELTRMLAKLFVRIKKLYLSERPGY